MSKFPNCPKCASEYTYEDGALYICPGCGNECVGDSLAEEREEEEQLADRLFVTSDIFIASIEKKFTSQIFYTDSGSSIS